MSMIDLISFRDYVYILCVLQSETDFFVVLDIYKYNSALPSPQNFEKATPRRTISSYSPNHVVNGICAGVINEIKDSCSPESFVMAIQLKPPTEQHTFLIQLYRAEFASMWDKIPSKHTKIGECKFVRPVLKRGVAKPQFLPGPSVLWISKSNILLWPCHETVKSYPINEDSSMEFVLLDVQFVKYNNNGDKHERILLACQKMNEDYSASLHFLLVFYNNQEQKFHSLQMVPIEYFVPFEYRDLILSIFVTLHSQVTRDPYNTNTCSNNFEALKLNSSYVVTNNYQFIVFINGNVRYCCQVPLFDYKRIFKVHQHSPYSCSFVLLSVKGVCIIQRNEKNKKLKVKEVWDNAGHAVYGDFVENGKYQLVIRMKSAKNSPESLFLTHLHAEETNSSIDKMQEALQRRLLLGQIAANKVEDSLRDKQQVLESALSSVRYFQSHGQLPENLTVPDYLTFMGQKDINPSNNGLKGLTQSNLKIFVKVLSCWNIVWTDFWIIGITLRNDSAYIISGFSGVILTEGQDIEAKTKLFSHQVSEIPCHPTLLGKESQKMVPNQMMSIVFSMKIPKMVTTELQANIILKWNSQIDLTEIYQQIPLSFSLKVDHIIQSRYFEELPVIQKLMSLRICQNGTNLTILSDSNFTNILENILPKTKTKDFPVLYDFENKKHYIFSNQTTSFCGVNFDIEAICETEVNFRVFCRDDNQLLVFAHWLYEVLPKGCLILPNEESEINSSCQELWEAMKAELEFVIISLNETPMEVNLSEKIEKVQKKTSVMITKLKDPVYRTAYSEYYEFRKTLIDLEITTDSIMKKISH